MNLHNVSFLISAVQKAQYPKSNLPEIAMVGRSNVGKSSLINKVLNRKNFARVSSKPGKTVTINFYDLDQKVMLVDLPGYGYARVSKSEKEKWGEMIQDYLDTRKQLACIFLLVDARHAPSEEDLMMLDWILYYKIPFYVIATKTDKLKASQRTDALELLRSSFKRADKDVIPFSAITGDGKERVVEILSELSK